MVLREKERLRQVLMALVVVQELEQEHLPQEVQQEHFVRNLLNLEAIQVGLNENVSCWRDSFS